MKFLLILLLIFIATPYLIRWLMPWILKGFVKRAQQQMGDQFNQGNTSTKKEGEININTPPSENKHNSEKDNLGDYVDFEEVKE